MRYKRIGVWAITIAPPPPPPPPSPEPIPDIDIADVSDDPAKGAPPGGVVFRVPSPPGTLPAVVYGVYMPLGFDVSMADEAIINSGNPKAEVPITGPADQVPLAPPADLLAGQYHLVVIEAFAA